MLRAAQVRLRQTKVCSAVQPLRLTHLQPEMNLQQSAKCRRQARHPAGADEYHRHRILVNTDWLWAHFYTVWSTNKSGWVGGWVQTWGESPPTFWRRSISCCFALRTAKACSCSSSNCCLRSAASRICCPQGESAGLESPRGGDRERRWQPDRNTSRPARFQQQVQLWIHTRPRCYMCTHHTNRGWLGAFSRFSHLNPHLFPLGCSSSSLSAAVTTLQLTG